MYFSKSLSKLIELYCCMPQLAQPVLANTVFGEVCSLFQATYSGIANLIQGLWY